jgi:putative ABC transport system permease protein
VNWAETGRTALEAIRTRRMRSALTVLGILIGIAAVMLTVGLGQGASAQVRAQISSLGSNLLIVSPGSSTSAGGIRGGRGSASTLTERDAVALGDRSNAPDIEAVAPVASTTTSLVNGSTNWTTSVVGTTPSWLPVRARSVAEGRFFTQGELDSSSPVVVLGATTAQELFALGSPVGRTLTMNGSTFTVIGVLNTVGSSTSSDEDDQAVVPQTAFASRVSTSSTPGALSTVYLEATSQDTLSAAYQEADKTLLSLHGIGATGTADFTINSQQSLLDTVTSTSKTLTVLLGGIAAVSLLVGGIGVMNIMLVSVTERIREIGLRKALGATPRVIRRQFLVEASLLGFAGGIAGLAVGAAGSRALQHAVDQPVTISGPAAAGALVVALVIGIVAGVYPAGRAARLAPIEALRSE